MIDILMAAHQTGFYHLPSALWLMPPWYDKGSEIRTAHYALVDKLCELKFLEHVGGDVGGDTYKLTPNGTQFLESNGYIE